MGHTAKTFTAGEEIFVNRKCKTSHNVASCNRWNSSL